MLNTVPKLLNAEQVSQFRQALQSAAWTDGKATAGYSARRAKNNQQLAADDPLGDRLGEVLLDALARNPQFMTAALPLKVFPPRFNRYEDSGHYGDHIDNAVLSVPGSSHRVRSDLSATLFLTEPAEYEGGELVIEDTYGSHAIKLAAGDLVLYPGTSLHRVTPVTRGVRLAGFFWIQSLVRDDSQRNLLWQLDQEIQQVATGLPDSPIAPRLTGIYHNLLRLWSDT
jgi:PKHD-type hydroxylase